MQVQLHSLPPAPVQTGSPLLSYFSPGKILFVTILIAATWVLLKWMRGILDRVEKYNPRLRFMLRQVEPPLRIAIWFISILVSVEVLSPSRDAFLAALGSAALAIGLGVQDLIKNLIGGLVIVVDRPFQTGDRVKLGEAEGEVKQIGLRSTKVYSDDGRMETIPNSDVLTKVAFNMNVGVPDSVVSFEMALPASSDMDRAINIGREIAVCCPYTHLGRPIAVGLREDVNYPRPTILTIHAHVYDHRFESAMRTDLLRRAHHEFLSQELLHTS